MSKERDVPRDAVRSTLWLEPALHQALRLKAKSIHRSMSDIVNDALHSAFREDEEDLEAFAERAGEPPISYAEFVVAVTTNNHQGSTDKLTSKPMTWPSEPD